MLTNQAKNLARIDFPELQELTTKLAAIDRLMGQAQGIDFRMNGLDAQIRRLFPEQVDAALTSDRQLQNAKVRLDTARSEEHTSELPSLMRISYAVFCSKKKKHRHHAIHQ